MTASGIERLERGFPGGPEVRTPAFPAMTLGSVPGWETNIPQATQRHLPLPGNKKRLMGEVSQELTSLIRGRDNEAA